MDSGSFELTGVGGLPNVTVAQLSTAEAKAIIHALIAEIAERANAKSTRPPIDIGAGDREPSGGENPGDF